MCKLDSSCVISEKEIGTIKYAIKKALLKHLPVLPDNVEMKLFFEGRDAWIFNWDLKCQAQSDPLDNQCIGVKVKLKKEFHYLEFPTDHVFLCKVQRGINIYSPEILILGEST